MLQNYFLLISYQRREVLENYFFGFLSAPQTAAELLFGFLSMPKTAAEKNFFFGFSSTPQSASELNVYGFLSTLLCSAELLFLVSYQRRKVLQS